MASVTSSESHQSKATKGGGRGLSSPSLHQFRPFLLPSMAPSSALLISFLLLSCLVSFIPFAYGTAVFQVRRKFPGRGVSLQHLRAHDVRRRGRMLAAIDIPLGGVGTPTLDGLYYAEIGLGTPSRSFHVQVDTGSDILWVNCYNCRNCPRKTDLGFELNMYSPRDSTTGRMVTCDDAFCSATYDGQVDGCSPGIPCQYKLLYGDGSGTTGFFITDSFQYNQVSGNLQTVLSNASISFGCGAQQSGQLDSSSEAVDGILGFGQSNSSMISQLASLGKVKKIFAHCLDTQNGGGGIFAIGNVVQPKVTTTPLVPKHFSTSNSSVLTPMGLMTLSPALHSENTYLEGWDSLVSSLNVMMSHYNVNLKGIDVGGNFLKLPTDLFDTSEKTGTIIDSGTTLTYLPEIAIRLLMAEITNPSMEVKESKGFSCFKYTSDIDSGFPVVTFHFEGSLTLKVYPHDYLFELDNDLWCVGFQSSASQSNDKEYFLLGDLVLSNKLVVYDLENQAIGWTEYNCSSSIGVRDDTTGAVYKVGSHNLSSALRLECGSALLLLLIFSVLRYFVH